MRTCASEKRSCFQRSSVPERREKLCPCLTKTISRFIGLGRKIRKRVSLRKLACPQRLQAEIARNCWTGLYLPGHCNGETNKKVVSLTGDQQVRMEEKDGMEVSQNVSFFLLPESHLAYL
ncbi:hypothetical protein NPIL_17931 [Nephila pilipes]|uniref:Uncharacterized protein n=1 Tax=Nephila pilipes TaxID=299642 RepID=A0A8X6MYC2_NEPPI|nr:hypothetical protein NPIL_17931 [Nephila pilipes]